MRLEDKLKPNYTVHTQAVLNNIKHLSAFSKTEIRISQETVPDNKNN